MRVRIKLEREPDGRWCALSSGMRGFKVSPVLEATRGEAVNRAQAAVLLGLAHVVERGRVQPPRELTFVVGNGPTMPAARPRTRRRRVSLSDLQLLPP